MVTLCKVTNFNFKKESTMDKLPMELAEKIGSCLDVGDLLNLSLTNRFWRNALNSDRIWRAICAEEFDIGPTENPILDLKCRVEPKFQVPNNPSDILSDICSWRIRYAQEIRTMNNWKEGRFVAEDFEPRSDLNDTRTRRCTAFINNILVYIKGNKFNFWNITHDNCIELNPIEYSSDSPVFRLLKNGFLYQDYNTLTYYTISEEKQFKFKFKEEINKESLDYEASICCHNDRYVVFQLSTKIFWYIIWDLEKCSSFVFHFQPEETQHVEFLREYLCEGDSSILYLAIHYEQEYKKDFFYVYDLNKREPEKILNSTRHSPGQDTLGEFLIIYSKNEMNFFNKDGKIVFSNPYQPYKISVVKSYGYHHNTLFSYNISEKCLKLYDSGLNLKLEMITEIKKLGQIKRVVEIGKSLFLIILSMESYQETQILLDLKKKVIIENNLPNIRDRSSYCGKSIVDFLSRKIYYFC